MYRHGIIIAPLDPPGLSCYSVAGGRHTASPHQSGVSDDSLCGVGAAFPLLCPIDSCICSISYHAVMGYHCLQVSLRSSWRVVGATLAFQWGKNASRTSLPLPRVNELLVDVQSSCEHWVSRSFQSLLNLQLSDPRSGVYPCQSRGTLGEVSGMADLLYSHTGQYWQHNMCRR